MGREREGVLGLGWNCVDSGTSVPPARVFTCGRVDGEMVVFFYRAFNR